MAGENIKEVVKEKYAEAALRVTNGGSSCCGAQPATGAGCDPITSNLYDPAEAGQLPRKPCWPRSVAATPRRSLN